MRCGGPLPSPAARLPGAAGSACEIPIHRALVFEHLDVRDWFQDGLALGQKLLEARHSTLCSGQRVTDLQCLPRGLPPAGG